MQFLEKNGINVDVKLHVDLQEFVTDNTTNIQHKIHLSHIDIINLNKEDKENYLKHLEQRAMQDMANFIYENDLYIKDTDQEMVDSSTYSVLLLGK